MAEKTNEPAPGVGPGPDRNASYYGARQPSGGSGWLGSGASAARNVPPEPVRPHGTDRGFALLPSRFPGGPHVRASR
jgi:hypothetical protein